MKRLLYSAMLWLGLTSTAHAQQTDFYGNATANNEVCFTSSAYGYDQQVEQLVTDLCKRTGLENRFVIVSCSNIANCLATVHNGKPYILYNTNYLFPVKTLNFSYSSELPKISDQRKWDVLGTLAHEMGHHLKYHLINPPEKLSQLQMELEADEYMGYTLAMMGASLQQTLAVLNTDAVPEQGNGYTHPDRERRKEAAKKGYERALALFPQREVGASDAAVLKILQQAGQYYEKEEYVRAFVLLDMYKDHPLFGSTEQYLLGEIYGTGRGAERNDYEAVKWYRKSADQGNILAQVSLGYCYYVGEGLPKNYTEAVKWFRKSAEQGDKAGQYYLGYMYYNGEGLIQNYTEAAKWWQKSAEQGSDDAAYNLAYMYEKGQGVEKNYAQAVKYILVDGVLGCEQAVLLASLYEAGGYGLTKDTAEAAKWYKSIIELFNTYGDKVCERKYLSQAEEAIKRLG